MSVPRQPPWPVTLIVAGQVSFFDQTAGQLITSPICIAEVLWLLGDPGNPRVLAAQNHLLGAVIEAIHLQSAD